jgi:hypothetical protein
MKRNTWIFLVSLVALYVQSLATERSPAEIHHLRIKSRGIGLKASHYDAIPLCPEHHRGQSGVHGMGTKGFAKHYGFDESDLLETTKILLEQIKEKHCWLEYSLITIETSLLSAVARINGQC